MGKKNSITKSVRASLTNYKPGDRLPGVAEVCEEYDASTAVSYTHLDVYKRQEQQGAERR